MIKKINENKISFFDENNEIFSLSYISDEFTFQMYTNEIVEITEDSEIYECLNNLFKEQYDFGENILNDKKTDNELIWHSDCYYNPDDEWSIKSISCLHILFDNNMFKIWCDKEINKKSNYYCICFSPAGNGKHARNINNKSSLQDDFIINIYQKLMKKNKVKKIVL